MRAQEQEPCEHQAPTLPTCFHQSSVVKAPWKRPLLCSLRTEQVTEARHLLATILVMCLSTEEGHESKLLILVSVWPYPGWQSHKLRKRGQLHFSFQRKADLKHPSVFIFQELPTTSTPHKPYLPPTPDQQLVHSSDKKPIIQAGPEALQVWGLLSYVSQFWGEQIRHMWPAVVKVTLEDEPHRWTYKRAFEWAGCNYLARNIKWNKDFRGDFCIH